MNIQQAWEIIKSVCEAHVGNFQVHQQIQSAMQVLADEINSHMESEEEPVKED